MNISKKLSLFLLVGKTILMPTMTFAQNKNCPVLPSKEVILHDAETPLYDEQNKEYIRMGLIPNIVYTIKPNQSFNLLDQSGELIDEECWYKVESPVSKKVVLWARFILVQKPSTIPSINTTLPKNKIEKKSSLKSKTTPINRPIQKQVSKNYSPYFFIVLSIIGIFFLSLLDKITLSLQKKSALKSRKKSKQISTQNSNNNQDNISKQLIDNGKDNSNPSKVSQHSNPSNISEQMREIELGILNYLRKNENASFIDLLSNLQCDKQLLRDSLLILQEEEFIKIVNKTDENNTIYKML